MKPLLLIYMNKYFSSILILKMSPNNINKLEMEKIFHGFYKNKIVLITGNTGFQGAWLTLWLKLLGAKIIGYSIDVPTQPSMFELLKLEFKITHVNGDIKNLEKIKSVINEHKPNVVFHFAAQSLVSSSYDDPIETFHTNILGTANILESIRDVKNTKVCVVMTSDKCYETPIDCHPCKEDDKMGGSDPYSASKGGAEIIVSSYRRSFFKKNNQCGIVSTRVGNVIGGGDWAKDRLIPDCIRALMGGKSLVIRNPQSIRPWQHVLEPLSAILWLAVKMNSDPKNYSGGWNFGPDLQNKDTTVKEVVKQILKEWNGSKFEYKHIKSSLHETKELRLDSTKAFEVLKWNTILSVKDAISKTINWYKELDENQHNIEKFTIEQIENYVCKACEKNLPWTKYR